MFETFILPVLIIMAIAALFAFGLAFLSEKLKVNRDEKIDTIRSCLSGANCGGCGYAGCNQFAEALFKGEASLDDCKPTSKENKDKIADILGVKASSGETLVAVVHCVGGNRCEDVAGYQGYGDCVSANMLAGGNKKCSEGCLGLRSCISACQYYAIDMDTDNAVPVVNRKNCISCGACLKTCPKKLIGFVPINAKVYIGCSNHCMGKAARELCAVGCIGCGLCAKSCPEGAITMEKNMPIIDYSKCSGCQICADKCPRKCIIKS